MAVDGQAQAAIENAQVGIAAQANAEIEAAVRSVPVIPVAVVGKTVAGCRMENRLAGLVDGIIVKPG